MRPDALDRAFRALADRTRRGVVERLQLRPYRAGELADALAVSAPALTRHLRVLRASELVEEANDDTDGRVRVYRLRPAAFERLRGWVDRIAAMWEAQLASFAAHVERAAGAAGVAAAGSPARRAPARSSSRSDARATATRSSARGDAQATTARTRHPSRRARA